MAHNIHIRDNGSAAFASTKREWHSLGAFADGAMTVADALAKTGLDRMRLEDSPLSATVITPSGVTLTDVTTHKAVYLHDADSPAAPILAGVVGADRTTFQPGELLEPMDVLASASGGAFETVGMLAGGKRWFATVKFPDGWTIGGDDHDGFLLGVDSADGSSSFRIMPTMVRVVCQNTLNMALSAAKGQASYSLRHTSNAKVSVARVREIIGMVPAYAAELDDLSNLLLSKPMDLPEFGKFTDQLFGGPDPSAKTTRSQTLYDNRSSDLRSLWFSDTQDSTKRNGSGTYQTAFQAITEYLDWRQPVRGDELSRRTERMVMGQTASTKAKALELLTA